MIQFKLLAYEEIKSELIKIACKGGYTRDWEFDKHATKLEKLNSYFIQIDFTAEAPRIGVTNWFFNKSSKKVFSNKTVFVINDIFYLR